MARRTTEALWAEIDRCDAFLRIAEEFEKVFFPGEAALREAEEGLPDKDIFVASGLRNGATLSEMLSGYEQAVNDHMAAFAMTAPDAVAYATGLRAYYRERTGRELLSDFPPPTRKLKAIVKRGKIRNDTEFYLVKECVDDLEDDPKTEALGRDLRELLGAYEAGG